MISSRASFPRHTATTAYLGSARAMTLRIAAGDIHLCDVRTRMPFRYGIATMTVSPHLFLRLRVDLNGRAADGVAADHLPPKWFTKDADRPVGEEVAEMVRVIEHAMHVAIGTAADTPFALWQSIYGDQHIWGERQRLPPLLTGFGTSLVERAMVDAVCRDAGQPFARRLRGDALGMRLGAIHSQLAGTSPRELLPTESLRRVTLRHTVGLGDPLCDADIASADRLDDGLPQSLEASITRYGLRHFKIKLSGDIESDRARLKRIADVLLRAATVDDRALSLDGNEFFHSLEAFRDYWKSLSTTPDLHVLLDRLLFVEQPMHRSVALDRETMALLATWHDRPAMIIDESDAELESAARAIELGYAGTSHKNCKGVFKGIANACLIASRRRSGDRQCLISGEDLANIGPVALLADLAVMATLGIESVERNGHHYFAGLSMFPSDIQRQILDSHGDLFVAAPQGWPRLDVREGRLRLDSVVDAPLGTAPLIDVTQFTPLAEWKQAAGIE